MQRSLLMENISSRITPPAGDELTRQFLSKFGKDLPRRAELLQKNPIKLKLG
ncbi:MAG: hypothetical protein Q7S22_06915 [Candidatus Micrarchaeota archaeon]|nr:hypothetical protein [Candidatus Micrarchaeota archaeon]